MVDNVTAMLGAQLMLLNEQVTPIHEWLEGQRAYFASQGYTDDEARAMAAAEFVFIFGSGITRTPRAEEDE